VEGNLISQGVELMLFGMGTVIVFLTLLVFATTGMSALINRFTPPPSADGDTAPVADDTLLAVIAAAIHKHRSRR
jgi:oxaloacetate decarboxylase gamma subunit